MGIIAKIKLLYTYGPELEQVLKDIKEKKEEEERIKRRFNLKLCEKHQQEQNHSHYSTENCDFCKLLAKYNELLLKTGD